MIRSALGSLLFFFSVLLVSASGDIPVVVTSPIEMHVYPAYAPNGPTSPSWTSYVTNAITAIRADDPFEGDRTVIPSGYEHVMGPILPSEMIYTNYHSWRGLAAPNPAFAALPDVFEAEYGNRIHFGLHIETDGTQPFSLSQITWKLESTDLTHYFNQSGTFASDSYSPARVGVNFGPDRHKGGGDDIVYDNGEAGSTVVDEFAYVGVGEGFFSSEPGPITDQDDINATLSQLLMYCDLECQFDLNATYTLGTLSATNGVEIDLLPGNGGDFDHDGQIDCDDIDLMTKATASGANDPLYDLNMDLLVNFDDLYLFVTDYKHTWIGDANCDGLFDSNDLVDVMIPGLYETGNPAVWSQGDFNGDGVFNTEDFIAAFCKGGYELGPRAAMAAAVPEPASALLAMLGVGLLTLRRRRG